MTQYIVSSVRYAFGGTHKIVTRDTVEGDELIRRDIELSTPPADMPQPAVEDLDWRCTGGKW